MLPVYGRKNIGLICSLLPKQSINDEGRHLNYLLLLNLGRPHNFDPVSSLAELAEPSAYVVVPALDEDDSLPLACTVQVESSHVSPPKPPDVAASTDLQGNTGSKRQRQIHGLGVFSTGTPMLAPSAAPPPITPTIFAALF